MTIIRSAAPIRLCDQGGWTDTWFAQHGCVFNLAAHPAVDVEIRVCASRPAETGEPPRSDWMLTDPASAAS